MRRWALRLRRSAWAKAGSWVRSAGWAKGWRGRALVDAQFAHNGLNRLVFVAHDAQPQQVHPRLQLGRVPRSQRAIDDLVLHDGNDLPVIRRALCGQVSS